MKRNKGKTAAQMPDSAFAVYCLSPGNNMKTIIKN